MRVRILVALLCMTCAAAFAADNGECGSPETMTTLLKAEGQHSFASAERVERKNNLNTLRALIFTTNADRSVGYILQADKPTGEKASRICVYARLAELRLFDARAEGVSPGALLKAGEADATRRCGDLTKAGRVADGTCGFLNTLLQRAAGHGERVLFQGFNVMRQENGAYKKDRTLTTVTGNVNGRLADNDDEPLKGIVCGIFFTSLPDGATTINVTMVYAEYTPYGLALLGS